MNRGWLLRGQIVPAAITERILNSKGLNGMFAVNSNSDGTFNLQWGGIPILSGCHPILALQNGTEPEWAADLFHSIEEQSDKTSEIIYRRSYRNADQSVRLALTVICSAETV